MRCKKPNTQKKRYTENSCDYLTLIVCLCSVSSVVGVYVCATVIRIVVIAVTGTNIAWHDFRRPHRIGFYCDAMHSS